MDAGDVISSERFRPHAIHPHLGLRREGCSVVAVGRALELLGGIVLAVGGEIGPTQLVGETQFVRVLLDRRFAGLDREARDHGAVSHAVGQTLGIPRMSGQQVALVHIIEHRLRPRRTDGDTEREQACGKAFE
jgi:hypothetical protein